MKKLFYLFLYFTLSIYGIHAQDCSDAIVTATPAISTCQSNGSITVTWSGTSAGNLVGRQYTLRSTSGSLTVGPISNNVFNNLPPGNYNIEAKGFCGSLSGTEIVRTLNNITVGGTYVEPRLSFVATSTTANSDFTLTSRNSFAGCATGLIAVFLENGNQTAMPTFTITAAPSGVTVPQVVSATKSTVATGAGWRYVLSGTWPAGTYTVSANDGCYSTVATFVINEIASIPTGTASASNFVGYAPFAPDCSKVYYKPYYPDITGNPDYVRYFSDGLLEYGIAPIGEMPKAENWFRVRNSGSNTSNQDLFDLSPGKFMDYYSTPTSGINTLTVYTRIKGFSCTTVSADTYLPRQGVSLNNSTNFCTGVRLYYFTIPNTSIVCFPLTVEITDKQTGALLHTEEYNTPNQQFSWNCSPGDAQYLKLTDASGYVMTENREMTGGTPPTTLPVKPNMSLRTESYMYNFYCDGYSIPYYISNTGGTPCDGESPYPCYITITETATGTVVQRDTLTNTGSKNSIKLEYQTSYTVTGVFPNWDNHTVSFPYARAFPDPTPTLADNPGYSTLRDCDGYRGGFTSSNLCYPKPVYVTVTAPNGDVIHEDTLTAPGYKYIKLEYGVKYGYKFVYPDLDNLVITTAMTVNSAVPTGFTLAKNTTNSCSVNRGTLRVSTVLSSGGAAYMLKDTRITITGPEGYVSQTYTLTGQGSSNNSNYTFPETTLPPGEYTATVESCGTTYVVKSQIAGGYAVENLEYTTERDCLGTKLFPSGSISLAETPLPTVYFRITGPAGSVNGSKVISSSNPSDYFTLTVPGTYTLSILPSSNGCGIGIQAIVYNPPPLALDAERTSAYSCPGGSTGYLTLQATNGVLPYTYSVYDKTNTTQLVAPQTSSTSISLDNFGVANETYTVRVSDACGNSFSQEVTLSSLDQIALAYGQEQVCYDSSINLYAFTVSDATYLWTGPNGFTSTDKNPVVPNASSINDGWYKVRITSQKCGIVVEDSINVKAYDPVVPIAIEGKMQEVFLCPNQALVIGQAATGGSGDYSYLWQYNTNYENGGNWNNLGSTNSIYTATTSSFIFTSTLNAPVYRYFRLVITDATCGVHYLYYHTNVSACMLQVNPNLKNPGAPKTEN